MAYILGTTVVSFCEFDALDVADLPLVDRTLTNPTAITVTVTSPTNVVSSPTPVNVTTGVYYVNIDADEVGDWEVEWTSTGAAAGVARKTFRVVA